MPWLLVLGVVSCACYMMFAFFIPLLFVHSMMGENGGVSRSIRYIALYVLYHGVGQWPYILFHPLHRFLRRATTLGWMPVLQSSHLPVHICIYMPGVLWRMYLPPGPMASLTANNHIALYCHSGPWRDMTRSGSEKSGSRESCTGPCSTAQASSLCTLKVCW